MTNVEQYSANKIVQLLINWSSCALRDAGDQDLEVCIVRTGWAITNAVLTLLILDDMILILNIFFQR